MTEINRGRWTAASDEPFVVFLIGMRLNKLWKVHKWGPVFMAMPRMIAELQRQPERGLLGADVWFGRTMLTVQYWRSFEHLEAYAKARDQAHLPAWTAFNRAVGASGDVGIFHETFRVAPGNSETLYANMPAMLFGKVGKLLEAKGAHQAARSRLSASAASQEAVDAPATAPRAAELAPFGQDFP